MKASRGNSPPRFGYHRHCGSGDMFVVVEEQDSSCSLATLKHIACHALIYKILDYGTFLRKHFLVRPMKFFQYWSHPYWVAIQET